VLFLAWPFPFLNYAGIFRSLLLLFLPFSFAFFRRFSCSTIAFLLPCFFSFSLFSFQGAGEGSNN